MRGQLMDSLYLEESPMEYFTMDFIPLPKRRSKKWRYFQEVVQQENVVTCKTELSTTTTTNDDDQAWRDLLLYSTGCWRNYVATWRVVDKQLYLAEVFGRYKISQPLHAVWVSQTSRIRKEGCVFDPLNDDNTFDFELHFQNGVLVALAGHNDQSMLTTPSTAVQS